MKTLAMWLLLCLNGLLAVATLQATEVGKYAEVTADEALIRSGEELLVTARKGDQFEIVEIRDPFFGVRVTMPDGTRRKGYLWNQQSKAVPAPLTPLYTPPPPKKYVRVTATEAPIRVGKTTVATTLKGDVLLLEREQPGWYWVKPFGDDDTPTGWLQAKLAQPLEHHGPSQEGFWPKSIQEASVVWADDRFVITADLPAVAGANLSIVAGDVRRDDIDSTGSGVGIPLEDDFFVKAGTKSLWLAEENGARHRLDLPSPEFSDTISSVRYESFPNAQYLSIELTNPVPGMWLEGCQVVTGREDPSLRRLERDRSADLSFVDIYQFKGKSYVRLGVRDLPDNLTQWVYLRARAPWGGSSNTIAIKRVDNKFDDRGTKFKDRQSGPVDAVTEVPNVELMPADLAKQVLETAGLKAEFVSAGDLQNIASPAPQAIVSRQGVAASKTMLLGETVLLSIGSNPTVSSPADASGLTIDIPDTLALVSLEPISSPNFALDESGLQWLTTEPSATGVMAIGSDGGVSLDPERSKERTKKAAFLKLMIASTLASSPDSMPGPIGAVFRELISDEDKLQQQIKQGQPLELASIASRVAEILQVNFTDADRRRLEEDWVSYSRYRQSVTDFDLQGNQFVSDDLSVWIIAWLFNHELYDPLKSTVPAIDTQGRPLAILFQPGQAPAWTADVGLPITPPGQIALPTLQILELIASLNQHAPPSTPPEKLTRKEPPKGDPLVYASDGPTQVRVPQVRSDVVSTADSKLSNLGLRIANVGQLLATDRVTASVPDNRTWVQSGSSVELLAQRRVPNILGYTSARVEEELARWNFKTVREGRVLASDIAVRQQPKAGEYASVDDPIAVSFNVMMPHLVGQLAEEGLAELKARDLTYRVRTKMFLQDKIVSQNPSAGTLVARGDATDLVVHTKVPPVTGRALRVARESLGNSNLTPSVPNQLARGEDIVRGQSPAAGEYVPHESGVRLSPVVTRVPNVVGNSLNDAQTVLDEQNNIGVRTIGDLLGRDRITSQNPQAGSEIERGNSVVLDARVPTPSVRGVNLFAASNQIRNANGELSPNIIGFGQNTDVVFSQNPNPGVLVMPRSTVSLTPGVNIPSVTGLSINEARQRLANVHVNSEVTSSGTQETANRGQVGRIVVDGQSQRGLHARSNIGQVNLSVIQYVLALRTVPNVHGMNANAAISAIERADLRVGSVVVQFYPRGGSRRMGVGEFRGFLLGQAIAALIGSDSSEQPRIQSAEALYTQAGAGTQLVAGDRVDLHVIVTITYGDEEFR